MFSIPLQEVKRPTRFLPAASLYNLPDPLNYDTESLLTDVQQLNILQQKLQQIEDRNNKLIAKLQGEGAASRKSLSFVESKRQTYLLRSLNCQPMAYAPKGTKSLEGERVQLVALTKTKGLLKKPSHNVKSCCTKRVKNVHTCNPSSGLKRASTRH